MCPRALQKAPAERRLGNVLADDANIGLSEEGIVAARTKCEVDARVSLSSSPSGEDDAAFEAARGFR